jgi:DNA-binding transcriptional LysR family regulator
MNIKDLKCFEIVFKEKSINTAAKKLFISPQGLGKIIQKMEEECNTSFFTRTKNGLIPTESGRLFFERSREISSRMHQLQEEIRHLDNNSKRFELDSQMGFFEPSQLV